jgi:hypothetical protein
MRDSDRVFVIFSYDRGVFVAEDLLLGATFSKGFLWEYGFCVDSWFFVGHQERSSFEFRSIKNSVIFFDSHTAILDALHFFYLTLPCAFSCPIH